MEINRYEIELQAFGKRLEGLRKKAGLTQLDVEMKSGINRPEISRIENGLRNIEFSTMVKLAEALGVDMEDFFKK